METLGTDCTNYFCTIQIQCYKIQSQNDCMTQTKKSRIIRKKGQEKDRSNSSMTRISQLLQKIFVDYKIEDKYFQGGRIL